MTSRRFAATTVVACLFASAAARGDFTNVINVPPDVIVPNAFIGSNTQINLYPGTTANLGDVLRLGSFNSPVENAQLNVLGGGAWAFEAWTGSELNVAAGAVKGANLLGGRGTMSGGAVDNWTVFANSRLEMTGGIAARVETAGATAGPSPDNSSFVITGGEVGVLDATGDATIQGGTIDNFFFRGGGTVEISGGSIGDDFEVGSVGIGSLPDDPTREVVDGSGGRVTVTGGSIGQRMILRDGRTLDYSGGIIGDAFQALEGSRVNIRGSHFTINGVELTWPADEALVISQRNVTLEGLLADGQSFRFNLNSEPGHGDYFSPAATVAIIPIPEPASSVLFLAGLMGVIVSGHHRGRRIKSP